MDLCNRREEMAGYSAFKKRIRKTTYQSSNLKFDRPSLAMTEFTVDYLRELAPRELGQIDMYWASSMCRESYISPCTLMVALMYARRLKVKNSKYLETVPSSNLLLVSMMVASKFLVEVDETTLEEWMKASCMESDDLYTLEMEFLRAIDWDLFVNKADFWDFLLQLEQRIVWRQYLKRNENFFTYTELHCLSQSREGTMWNHFVRMCLDIVKVLITFSLAYSMAALAVSNIPWLSKTSLVENLGVIRFDPLLQLAAKPLPMILDVVRYDSPVDHRASLVYLGAGQGSGDRSTTTQSVLCCTHCDAFPGVWTNFSSSETSRKKNCTTTTDPNPIQATPDGLQAAQAHLVFQRSYSLS